MYSVNRKDNYVTISGPSGKQIYSTTQDAFVVYKEKDSLLCKQVRELSDNQLILALASAVRIITDDGRD